jgi:prefoldin subunit 5
MSSFFKVDLEVLQQFMTTLRKSGDHMDTALQALKDTTGAQIGTPELDSAAHDFKESWNYGLGQLTSAIKDTNEGVSKAHEAYKDTEDAIGKALTQLAQAIGGAGGKNG